jgi:hypothetical protein
MRSKAVMSPFPSTAQRDGAEEPKGANVNPNDAVRTYELGDNVTKVIELLSHLNTAERCLVLSAAQLVVTEEAKALGLHIPRLRAEMAAPAGPTVSTQRLSVDSTWIRRTA